MMKTKKLSRGKLVKKLDAVFSQYVRLHYSNKNGICECYTCGEKLPRKKIQNGHFISRGNYKYRWDINNCRPQCMACNIFKHGNYIEYTIKMIKEYGTEQINILKNDKQLVKVSTSEIEELIDKYSQLVGFMIHQKGLDKPYRKIMDINKIKKIKIQHN